MSLPGNPHGGLDKKRCIVLPTYPVVPDLEHPLCKPFQDFFVNFRYLDFAIPRAAVGLVWPVLDCLILVRDNVAGPPLSSQLLDLSTSGYFTCGVHDLPEHCLVLDSCCTVLFLTYLLFSNQCQPITDCINPFTPKSDQFQNSPAASPEILYHTV